MFEGSPADHGGIKLGNQILQINGNDLAVTSKSELRDLLHQAEKVVVVVQDHPSASSFRLRKDDDGLIGLNMQGNKIIGVMKGTHAAKSGVLAEHHLLDVEDTSVTGLYDSDVGLLLKEAAEIFTIKVIPSVIYNRMIQGYVKYFFCN